VHGICARWLPIRKIIYIHIIYFILNFIIIFKNIVRVIGKHNIITRYRYIHNQIKKFTSYRIPKLFTVQNVFMMVYNYYDHNCYYLAVCQKHIRGGGGCN